MYSIGEFATIGRVSVRMLRHYDAIGLLPPARVDPSTGYRRYQPSQLTVLNQVVTLRELGCSLEQIAVVLASPDDPVTLGRLLRERRTALERQTRQVALNLRRIEERLRVIEGESPMSTPQISLKPLPAVRLAELTTDVEELEQSSIGPAIGPLFDRLIEALTRAGVFPVGPAVAYYTSADSTSADSTSADSTSADRTSADRTSADSTSADRITNGGGGPAVRVHAGFPVLPSVSGCDEWSVVELGPVADAASLVHHGAMATIGASWATLREWIAGRADLRPMDVPREVYLEAQPLHDQSGWVTELQWPVDRT